MLSFIRRIQIIGVLFIFGILNTAGQQRLVSGLYFSSHEVIQDKRTSLNLTPNDPLKMPKGFSIEFEANFREGDGYYGYIFRIIGDEKINVDLVSNLASSKANFWLVVNDHILSSYKWSDIPNGDYGKWLKIKVEVDAVTSSLAISFNGVKQEASVNEINGLERFNISFGVCKNKLFSSTDVCPMSLKDIRIYTDKNKLSRSWKLSKHGRNNCIYDDVTNAKAFVENPRWFIDRHVKWMKRKDFQVDKLLGIAKDTKNGRLFLVDENNVYALDCENWETDTISFEKGGPYQDVLAKQMVYNPFTEELWSYSFDEAKINRFDQSTGYWSAERKNISESDFAHNNKFISPIDSSLVSIFGYGHYTYNSIVNHYNCVQEIWEQTDRSDQIAPRYLSGAGFMSDSEILVFGGYGSKTGRQELAPGPYYDLFVFDLKDFSFRKLWSLPSPETPFVPCEDLVYNEDLNCFYTLVFNNLHYETFLRLGRFEIDNPDYELYTDSIPFKFLDTKSWVRLFLNEKKTELIAAVAQGENILVYSIAYPPLMPEEVYQDVHYQKSRIFSHRWWLVLFILLLPVIIIYLIRRGRKAGLFKPSVIYDLEQGSIDPPPQIELKKASSILFLNGFQVFDSCGNDITSEFSPTMKNLFIFIFLNTVHNGKGISSTKIDEILWSDKSEKSARNNRNVNISKLRTVLEKVGDIEVVNDNSLWKIHGTDEVDCDYIEILKITERIKISKITESETLRFVGLLSLGELFSDIHAAWIDSFKSAFAEEVIDAITALFNTEYLKTNLSLQYHMVDCLFTYDPLNEKALAVKCQILDQLGKRSTAKHVYDSFCAEYSELLGEKFAVPFKDLINKL